MMVFVLLMCQRVARYQSGSRAGLGCRRARVQIAAATLSGNSLRQTVHTHRASVHQAAKLVAALLRVARVTAGPAQCNGSLLSGLWHVTCRLTGKNKDQLWNPMLDNRVWATFTFFMLSSFILLCQLACQWHLLRFLRCSHSVQTEHAVTTAKKSANPGSLEIGPLSCIL